MLCSLGSLLRALCCAISIFCILEQKVQADMLLVSSSGSNSIQSYDLNTGAYLSDFVPAASGGLSTPLGLAVGSDGNVYVSSMDTGTIKRYSGTNGAYLGNFATVAGGPVGLTFRQGGDLYVTS